MKYGQESTSELLLVTVLCYKVAIPHRIESLSKRA